MIIASRVLGYRTIMGTDWPIENVVYRCTKWNQVYWHVAFCLCNGVPQYGRNYKTRREALAAAGITGQTTARQLSGQKDPAL